MAMQHGEHFLSRLSAETETAFDWLVDGLQRGTTVTFVPNPGNIGDAMINLACWRYLQAKFDHVAICAASDHPSTECVFIGGGGNLVEPLYHNTSTLLSRLRSDQRAYLLPVTICGYSDLLRARAGQLRILCRDEISFRHALAHLEQENVRLGHDAAFLLGAWLQTTFADKIGHRPDREAHLYRTDREGLLSESGGLDIMGQHYSDWVDMALAERVIRLAASYILGFGRIHTDRLHGAILSAILDRETVFHSNCYFKNAAVFERSLSRLPNVSFDRASAMWITPDGKSVTHLRNQAPIR